ncbi:GntR family transcriptional regulator [Solirhodobacter olei]|uniref:GntR family transcriptional regulator n=1 Tax=Solirhodobacter olei TaxID=2493082 RepID=UPI000FDC26BD|nr:GntR family transcriptional regulator [Solirhodobacter olei]
METPGSGTQAMRALIALRERILAGTIGPGTRLLEVPLSEALEISRTPLREAMARLVEEGLLERVRAGGFVVRSFGFQDVIDAIELRGVLEGTAARLAAERGVGEEALTELGEVVSALDLCFGAAPGEVEFERYSELNAGFHERLSGLAGSSVIKRELDRVTRLPFASPSAFLPDKADIVAFRRSLNVAQDQHRAMVAAIAGREGARAEALAREHARLARQNLEYVMEEDRSLLSRVPGMALMVG